MDGLGERVGCGVGLERVGREEREAEAKVGGREDSQSLDEDVGGRLIAGEVGVELVSAVGESSCQRSIHHDCWHRRSDERWFREKERAAISSDRANNNTAVRRG